MGTIQKTLATTLLALSLDNAFAAGSPGVEHNTQAFLDALAAGGAKPLEQLSTKDARAVLTGAQASVKVDLSGVEVSDRSIAVGEQIIKLKVVRPAKVKGELPVFMFFHGGGWVLGDFPTHQRLIRDLVVGSGAVAVYVDYTPSPEAQYPTAINQAYAATRWVAEHGKDIGVDGKRLAVAGNSVGGNMAAVVALMAKEQKAPALRFQLLMWPVTNAGFDSGSYQQFAEQQVTDLRHHPQIALVHQATGQAVRGAARGADQPGDFLEVTGATGHGLNHTQTAKQGLSAGGRGVLGDFWGVFLHIQPLPLSE